MIQVATHIIAAMLGGTLAVFALAMCKAGSDADEWTEEADEVDGKWEIRR